MNKEYKGKLSSKKVKKGFHIEISYHREGKPKKISQLVPKFPGEFKDLEVIVRLEGNHIVEIKKPNNDAIWKAETKDRSSVTKYQQKDQQQPHSKNFQIPDIKTHDSVKEFIKSHKGYYSLNPFLRFNRFVYWDSKQNKFDFSESIRKDKPNLHLECNYITSDIMQRIRWLTDPNNFKFTKNLAIQWTSKTQWRMVIGLGSPHVHETAMTWHHTWSIPYIPGSALKGVARSYYLSTLWEKFAKDNPDESWEKTIPCLEAWMMDESHPHENKVGHNSDKCPVFKWAEINLKNDRETFQAIFGTQKRKGMVIFMDAYPIERYCLKLDVMNVHYPDYYGGKKDYAADWESPNPVFFLTVVDTNFKGILLVDAKRLNQEDREKPNLSPDELLEKARNLLINALQTYGIGAKTSVGYGLMEIR